MDPQAALRAQFPDLTDNERTKMLDNLTDEERAGLLDPDLVDGVGKIGDPQPGDDAEGEEPEEEDAGKTPPPEGDELEEEGEEDADAEAGTDANAAAVDETPDDYVPAARPRMPWKAPENAETTLKQFDDDLSKAAEDFENGDLGAREYQTKVNEISGKKVALQGQINEANLAFNINRQGWVETCEDFLGRFPGYRTNERLLARLDAEVKTLQESADDPFDPTILAKAKRLIEEDIVALGGTPPAAKSAKAAAPKNSPAPRKVAKRGEPPPTLANLPASDATETDTSGYAALDRLASRSPEKFEAALARMSDAERDAYLASG